jgi:hypothetical protein
MEEWWVVGNLGGNKWLITKLYDEKSLHEYKTCYLEDVKVGDKLIQTQLPEIEDAAPEDVKNAGITNNDDVTFSINPDSSLGLFFVEKLQETLQKLSYKKNMEQ